MDQQSPVTLFTAPVPCALCPLLSFPGFVCVPTFRHLSRSSNLRGYREKRNKAEFHANNPIETLVSPISPVAGTTSSILLAAVVVVGPVQGSGAGGVDARFVVGWGLAMLLLLLPQANMAINWSIYNIHSETLRALFSPGAAGWLGSRGGSTVTSARACAQYIGPRKLAVSSGLLWLCGVV